MQRRVTDYMEGMIRIARSSIAIACIGLAGRRSASPAERSETPPGRRIADVALLDRRGNHHRLFRYKADKGLVLYAQRIGCPIVAVNLPKIAALRARFEAQGIRFLILQQRR